MRSRYLLLLFCLLVAALCVRLGVWQLDRLSGRRARNDVMRAQLAAEAVDARGLLGGASADSSLAYRRVRADGVFDYTREFALARRPQAASPGVHLVTPMTFAGTDSVLLVVRGWVYAADAVTVDLARWREEDTVSIEGYTGAFPPDDTTSIDVARSASAVSRLDRAQLSRRVGAPVMPLYVVMTSDATPDSTRPARLAMPLLTDGPHLSYAVQWFLFATIFGAGGTVVVLRGRRASATGSRL